MKISEELEKMHMDYVLRKALAEAEKAEVELETAKLVRDHVRAVKQASELPSFKVS